MTVYTLPKKPQDTPASIQPIKNSPDSLYYVVVKTAGCFQIITKDGGVVQQSFPTKSLALDWLVENDDSSPYKEAA